ncbi:MAG: type II toxin-antitoxin system prevent-host-death family antitoxin [Planctomycetes bacterium]|nr:type II toxin-antitoxin system prevent-host-death family antitoxin [Planctomycetota bacterium]MCC8116783.1 type II toxin-antitoxin system prevent-host-death family antitoxin [Planctomycetota bacterium]MCD7897556.1 type II toxin-antitoxin system prevent-host-death family antitoxin [Planctomycetaceae bacterium]
MEVINIHDAKTHLAKLVEKAAAGESFVIAKAGKPLVKVTRVDAPEKTPSLLGCMRGEAIFDENLDIKKLGADEVVALFEGSD